MELLEAPSSQQGGIANTFYRWKCVPFLFIKQGSGNHDQNILYGNIFSTKKKRKPKR